MYFNVMGMGLGNTYYAIILPVAINTFNLMVMRSAFDSIPNSLKESAYLDGAGIGMCCSKLCCRYPGQRLP